MTSNSALCAPVDLWDYSTFIQDFIRCANGGHLSVSWSHFSASCWTALPDWPDCCSSITLVHLKGHNRMSWRWNFHLAAMSVRLEDVCYAMVGWLDSEYARFTSLHITHSYMTAEGDCRIWHRRDEYNKWRGTYRDLLRLTTLRPVCHHWTTAYLIQENDLFLQSQPLSSKYKYFTC